MQSTNSVFQYTVCCFLGLTCTEQNFVTKAGSQELAAEHGVIVVAPDTSPSKFVLLVNCGTR